MSEKICKEYTIIGEETNSDSTKIDVEKRKKLKRAFLGAAAVGLGLAGLNSVKADVVFKDDVRFDSGVLRVNDFQLATNAGTGCILKSNSVGCAYWASPSSGVAGSDRQIQFNNSGSIGADADFSFGTYGQLKVGFTEDGTATLDATYGGDFAGGYVRAGGTIRACNNGGFAFGYTNGAGSTIQATGEAAFAMGSVQTGGDVLAGADGTFSQGYVGQTGAYSGLISTTGIGSFAQGQARASTANAQIIGVGNGTFAQGRALNADIYSYGPGSFAQGHANGFNIYAGDTGAFAQGSANTGTISAAQNGSFAQGNTAGSGSGLRQIRAQPE